MISKAVQCERESKGMERQLGLRNKKILYRSRVISDTYIYARK